MKDRAIITFQRNANGEVTGKIVNDKGDVVETKHFGKMTEKEYRRMLKLIEMESPEIGRIDAIEVTGN